MNLKNTLLVFATVMAFSKVGVQAVTINWGNDVLSSLHDSSGALLEDSFTFELGTFGVFIPTEFNMSEWEANWRPLDRAQAPVGGGWNSAMGYFTSSTTLQSDGTSSEAATWSFPALTFSAGELAYIWTYNTQTLVPNLSEWALFTNGFDGNATDHWLLPSPTSQTNLPWDWRLTDATFTPFGAINDTQGPGDYSNDPGVFDLQTHTTPVPEPASALLIALAGMLRLRRRHRRHI